VGPRAWHSLLALPASRLHHVGANLSFVFDDMPLGVVSGADTQVGFLTGGVPWEASVRAMAGRPIVRHDSCDIDEEDIESMLAAEAAWAQEDMCYAPPERDWRPVATPTRASGGASSSSQASSSHANLMVAQDASSASSAPVQEPVAPVAVVVPLVQEIKRRRVVGKQQDPAHVVLPEQQEPEEADPTSRQARKDIFDQVRGLWVKEMMAASTEEEKEPRPWRERQATLQRMWSRMCQPARLEAVRALATCGKLSHLPSAVQLFEELVTKAENKVPKVGAKVHCMAFLITFHGSWGVFDDQPILAARPSVPVVAAALRRNEKFRTIVSKAEDFAKELMRKFAAGQVSASLELCTRTMKQSGTVRVHLHIAVSKTNGRMYIWSPELMKFMGSAPADFQHPCGRGHNFRGQLNRLHFYCQVCKQGALWSYTNYPHSTNFQVDPRWIQSLWEMEKVTFDEARVLFVQTKRNVQKMLENMDSFKRHNDVLLLEQQRQHALTHLFSQNKTWKVLPEVEQWKAQWSTPLLGRRKFLVIEGPSSIGKSFFCLSQCGMEATTIVTAPRGANRTCESMTTSSMRLCSLMRAHHNRYCSRRCSSWGHRSKSRWQDRPQTSTLTRCASWASG